MTAIKQLRELGRVDATTGSYSAKDERVEIIDDILYEYGEVVDRKFENGGRWSNYEMEIYKVTDGDEVAYFQLDKEVPATESQEGMDCLFEFEEVEPYEVTTTKYRRKRS